MNTETLWHITVLPNFARVSRKLRNARHGRAWASAAFTAMQPHLSRRPGDGRLSQSKLRILPISRQTGSDLPGGLTSFAL